MHNRNTILQSGSPCREPRGRWGGPPMPESGETKAYLEAIRKVTGELTSTLDVGEVFREVVRLTAGATGAKGSALRLLDERTQRLELSASWGLSAAYLAKGPIDGAHSLSGGMKGEIVHIRDVRAYPEEEMEFLRALADLGALAIEHARLYSNLKADHESLIGEFHTWFESSGYSPPRAPPPPPPP